MGLEAIITHGTSGSRRGDFPSNHLTCADGFKLSVIAHPGAYCSPRPALLAGMHGEAPYDYPGPYTHVEVGYPSARPEPWSEWEVYCEDPKKPTDTVYGYVPVELVRALVAAHEGAA